MYNSTVPNTGQMTVSDVRIVRYIFENKMDKINKFRLDNTIPMFYMRDLKMVVCGKNKFQEIGHFHPIDSDGSGMALMWTSHSEDDVKTINGIRYLHNKKIVFENCIVYDPEKKEYRNISVVLSDIKCKDLITNSIIKILLVYI